MTQEQFFAAIVAVVEGDQGAADRQYDAFSEFVRQTTSPPQEEAASVIVAVETSRNAMADQ